MVLDYDKIAYFVFNEQMTHKQFNDCADYVLSGGQTKYNDEIGSRIYSVIGKENLDDMIEDVIWNSYEDSEMLEALGKEFRRLIGRNRWNE